ncbi:glycosyltransferase family 4 protein [Halomonas tibetensis]|uniref:Glycosyltransferase family 4 protein n=1 Tax=Halomonas tibetensis TaxID=2259590 RepID=A0ABV7B4Z8_9GAMM
MKLLINLDCMQPPLTGIGHYTQHLATQLSKHPEVDTFRGLYRSRWLDGTQLQDCPHASRPLSLLVRPGALRRRLRQVPGSYSLRQRLREVRFVGRTRHCGDHIYWEPGLELMPFPGRRVATIYDLSHLNVPDSHPPSRAAYLSHQIDNTLRHADVIVTISDTMRREIADYSGLNENDIVVVSPAASTDFRPLNAATRTEVRRRLGLPDRFILCLGTLEPRKNLTRFMRAYAELPTPLRKRWPLVCVGTKGWNDTSLVRNMQRLEARGELLQLGYVAQPDIPLITASADLLAYPSLYEGFGMPVVEAMACGVPVLTSRGTAMHEITGEHAFLMEPTDIASIRSTLQTALEHPEARDELGDQGITQAARYDWQRSAETLVAALRGGPSGQ